MGSLIAAAAAVLAGSGPTFAQTQCANHASLRQPFFGDLHVHTRLSFDAFPWDPPNGPYQAYDFATGGTVDIPPRDPQTGLRLQAKLARPLDFAAVTDHAEGFGETGVCMDPQNPGYFSPECIIYRDGEAPPVLARGSLAPFVTPDNAYLIFGAWFYGDPLPTATSPMSFCLRPDVDCDKAERDIWEQQIQGAAEEYDAPCSFTTFVGYEWTGTPLGANLHRNVIFRNSTVPERPISKTDTGPDPAELWNRLDQQCLSADPPPGAPHCDALVIPHNPNLSAGQQFLDPASPEAARLRARFEPLVEIMQAKGSSECRPGFMGAGNPPDELCNFELLSNGTFFPFPRPEQVFGPEFTERSFVRNILKAGLALGRPQSAGGLGVNPFTLGFVGDTDSHFGTPGNTDEQSFQGSHPSTTSPDDLAGEIENNPGGLAVAWAEENSRDSIFDALRRRETYATSGTRPIVRFFGGWGYSSSLCSSTSFAADGYSGGVPMGGFLGDRPAGADAPRFAVSALKDTAGTDLQAVQIVKGWADDDGTTHEQVYDVAGDRNNQAGVDPDTCATTGSGSSELCTVWTDPDFDPAKPAFWYVRVLENPTCRWSTPYCRTHSCSSDPLVPQTIQERAWTSPIWWNPPSS